MYIYIMKNINAKHREIYKHIYITLDKYIYMIFKTEKNN